MTADERGEGVMTDSDRALLAWPPLHCLTAVTADLD